MSFMIFVTLAQKDTDSYKREILERLLGSCAVKGRNGEIVGAKFGDQDWGEIYGADHEIIESGLAFIGGGKQLDQIMWEIADQTHSFIYWPSEPLYLCITSEAVLPMMPREALEEGEVRVVRSGSEIRALITGELK